MNIDVNIARNCQLVIAKRARAADSAVTIHLEKLHTEQFVQIVDFLLLCRAAIYNKGGNLHVVGEWHSQACCHSAVYVNTLGRNLLAVRIDKEGQRITVIPESWRSRNVECNRAGSHINIVIIDGIIADEPVFLLETVGNLLLNRINLAVYVGADVAHIALQIIYVVFEPLHLVGIGNEEPDKGERKKCLAESPPARALFLLGIFEHRIDLKKMLLQ